MFARCAAWVVRFSWVIACAACPLPAFSEPVPIWSAFTSENSDLPNNHVLALAPSADGALWIGTNGGGLARLDKDGRWQSYNKANSRGGLPDDRVFALAPGADGAVWIGTDGGLARLDKDGRWQTYSKASTNGGLPDDGVLALAPGPDGAVWIGTKGGLARLDKDWRWQTYSKASTKGGLPGDGVFALAPGADGALWIGTNGGGLARLDKDGRWQTYTVPTYVSVEALALGADGALWWVGTFSGLARLDKDGRWQSYRNASIDVFALAPAADGAIWIGTPFHGLARLDKDGHWQIYTKANTKGGLPDDGLRAVALGTDGALWIGTDSGLARLDKDGRWQIYSKANTKGGLPGDYVSTLAPSADGALWIGTDSGLARLDKDGHWQTYSTASTKGGLPNNSIAALAPGADGALWIGTNGGGALWGGTNDGGLARLDKDGRWQTYSTASTNGGLPVENVNALALGADGALWIGTSGGGLARLDKAGRWHTYSKASTNGGLPNDFVLALTPGADSALWIGTKGGGLARLDKDGRWQTYSNASTKGGLPGDHVSALAPGADGALWIGTHDGGLARLHKDGSLQTYSAASTNGGLPNNSIGALAPSADGALWIGTNGAGLARLDKDGHWQTYSNASTKGGLPDENVNALALGADGALWIGSGGSGLGYFQYPPTPTHRILEVIGEISEVSQGEQTVSVVAFDSSYRTEPWMFRYVWHMTEHALLTNKPGPETRTKTSVYRAPFDHDGDYQLRVWAMDRNGEWSEPRDINFRVALPKPNPTQEMLLKVAIALASTGVLYFILIFPLIPLYPHLPWARTAVNSGAFTKFPLAHKAILNTRWARGYLFQQLATKATGTKLPKPYITQSLFAAADKDAKPLTLDGSREGLRQFFAAQRRALLVARSGTGKSVFLRHLQREVAARFQRGERVPAPVLIDLRTYVLSGRKVQDLVHDALHGASVELADGDLDFLIGKGGFLILVDSLNELPEPADARLFHTFFNQDAGNLVLVASQVDLIRRQDTPLFNLAEVTPEQAASFLAEAVGREIYSELPQEAQALARNPQDLALLAEIAKALGTAHVPTHRAELYREILNQDGALRPWIESGDPLLAVIYGLAFRMVAERRVLQDGQLREWIAADPTVSGDAVAKVMQAMQASPLFRREVERNVLGKEQLVTGFRHELIGKFLAARHVRRMIGQGAGSATVDYISLSGDELWLDMFYFVIDEIDSSLILNRFLREILAAGGPARERITAYTNKTREAEVESEVLESYKKAKLDKDLALTPAA